MRWQLESELSRNLGGGGLSDPQSVCLKCVQQSFLVQLLLVELVLGTGDSAMNGRDQTGTFTKLTT